MDHRWIGTENPTKLRSTIPVEYRAAKVEVLIDKERGGWNRELINNIFEPEDAATILTIPLSTRQPNDKCIWRFTKTGNFSVKSAYHAAVARFSNSVTELSSASSTPNGWRKIWTLCIIPRVKMFLWKACTNSLPTRGNLLRRGCCEDAICGLCGEENETIDHIMLRCPISKQVWYTFAMRLEVMQEGPSTFRELLWESFEKFPSDYTELLAYNAWEIWNNRNRAYFKNSPMQPVDIMLRAHAQWLEFTMSREMEPQGSRSQRGSLKWRKPENRKQKLNCDVAVWSHGRVGLGFVLRDHEGKVILAGKNEQKAEGSTALLEGLALRYAMQMLKQYHLKADYVECDNKTMVESINGGQPCEIYCEVIVEDIHNLMMEIGCKNVNHISRQANQVAHYLAHGPDLISIRHSPEHVKSFIDMDVID